jgi:hypothetical protein
LFKRADIPSLNNALDPQQPTINRNSNTDLARKQDNKSRNVQDKNNTDFWITDFATFHSGTSTERKGCRCECKSPLSKGGEKSNGVSKIIVIVEESPSDPYGHIVSAVLEKIINGEKTKVMGTTQLDDSDGDILVVVEFGAINYGLSFIVDRSFTEIIDFVLIQPLDVLSLSAAANAPPPPDSQPILNVSAFVDIWGCNLGEMAASVRYTGGLFPNGYLGTNLVASLLPNAPAANPLDGVYQTLYSARPNLETVLKGSGSSLLEQTNGLNEEDPSGYDNGEFYARIIAYSTLKYFLSGLISNGKFNDKWLLGKYNECFLKKLGKSKFEYYLQFFVDPKYGFVGLNRYFLEEKDKCQACIN